MNLRKLQNDNNERLFAIHGGGNIGLGLMADVVSQSPFNYRIVATSNDVLLRNIVNSRNELHLQHNSNNKNVTPIKNIQLISRDFDDIVHLYKQASILAICLTPLALKSSVKGIAQGLIERNRTHGSKLKIFVLMNLPNCAEMVKNEVAKEIFGRLSKIEEAIRLCRSVEFIPTVVDRIVTKLSSREIKNQLKCQLLSCISIDFINSKWINQQVTDLLNDPESLSRIAGQLNFNFTLFNAEKNYALYVPNQIEEAAHFPALQGVANLKELEAIKNKYINGPHAIIAWLGALRGCKTIASAIQYPGIKKFIEELMDQEIAPVLLAEYPNLTEKELRSLKELFFKRCEESIHDPVERVGRDPLRKLNSSERIRGTIELNKKHAAVVSTRRLEYGMAAAILYAVKRIDPDNGQGQKICEIYEKNKSYSDILTYKGPCGGENFNGLDLKHDTALIINILKYISMLENRLELQRTGKTSLAVVCKSEPTTQKVLQHLSRKRPYPRQETKQPPVTFTWIEPSKPELRSLAAEQASIHFSSIFQGIQKGIPTKQASQNLPLYAKNGR